MPVAERARSLGYARLDTGLDQVLACDGVDQAGLCSEALEFYVRMTQGIAGYAGWIAHATLN